MIFHLNAQNDFSGGAFVFFVCSGCLPGIKVDFECGIEVRMMMICLRWDYCLCENLFVKILFVLTNQNSLKLLGY